MPDIEPLALDLPEEFHAFTAGWKTFVATLPPYLYAKLQARAESDEMPLALEAGFLLTYALDNAPRPSEAHLEPLTEQEREEAMRVRMRVAAMAVGAEGKPGA